MLAKKIMPKKSVASKCPRGSFSSEYDHFQFFSADVEGRFNASVTRRSRIRERRFDIDIKNAKVEDFQRIIHSRGWQLFCKHPNAIAMTVVCEFFANAPKGTSGHTVFIREKQVKYDAATINQLLCLLYNPSHTDEVEYMMMRPI